MELLRASLILLLILKLNSAKKDCHIYEGRCVFVESLNGRVTYDSAQTNCAKHGGRLVSVSNAAKNEFILHTVLKSLSSDKFWFGLRKLPYSSSWQRSDGSTLSGYDFAKWTDGHNDYYNRDKDCATIQSNSGSWHRINCRDSHKAICEIPIKDCELSDFTIKNAQFDQCGKSTSVKMGTNISVSCNPGYILHGPEAFTCTPTGWSDIPTCKAGCLPPELPAGVKIFNKKSEYKTGEELMIYCKHGYLLGDKNLKTHQIVECDSDGKWPFLKHFCISDQQLKCQDHICNEVSISAKLNSTVLLNCPLDENGTQYSHFRWIKNHKLILSTDKTNSINETGLVITNFKSNSVGTYSCVRGHNETNMQKIIIYDVRIQKSCPESEAHNLPAVTVNEGESLYLFSSSAGLITAVNWFKDDKRLIANKDRSILPNGDVLVEIATHNDQGNYRFEVESEVPNCFNEYTMDVYVKAKAESVCGISNDKNDQPWLVPLISQDETTPFCYGTLINEQWVVSSAFCLSRFYRRKTTNVVAQFRLHPDFSVLNDDSNWEIPVEQFVVHPQYSRRLSVNDIGLVKLKELVTFSKTLKPICLSSRDIQIEHDNLCEKGLFTGIVSGWGSIEALTEDDLGPVGTENLTVVAKEICQKYVSFEFPDKMFCVSRDESDKSLAKLVGDSGSPFLVRDSGRYYLQGIFSWGERIAQVGNYDYFTKVASYYDWIKTTME